MNNQTKNIIAFGERRRGINLTCRTLEDYIERIEEDIRVKTVTQKYKLLKTVIKLLSHDPNGLIERGDLKALKYRFEGKKLFINGKEVN